jgi:hypothetical protein
MQLLNRYVFREEWWASEHQMGRRVTSSFRLCDVCARTSLGLDRLILTTGARASTFRRLEIMLFKGKALQRTECIIVVAVLAELSLSSGAFAAAPSLGYPKGRPYYGSERASRSVRHARSYARGIYQYSRGNDQIEPAVAKAESEELGRNITKAQKDLAAVRNEAGNDAKTLAALKAVDEHLAAAAAHHKMLHEECCKDAVHGDVCMKHCNEILLELDIAQAKQDALIRSLEIGKGSTSGASGTHQHP